MKKIFSLLAALIVLSTSGVWAQDASTTTTSKMGDVATEETAIADLEDGYYVIQAKAENKVGYIYYNGNTAPASAGPATICMKYNSIVKDTIGTGRSLAYVWRVTPSADKKQLVIQCAGNGGFWPIETNRNQNMGAAKTIANAAVYAYPTEIDSNVGIRLYQVNPKLDGKDLYIHKNSLNNNTFRLSYWDGAGTANGSSSACCFKFYNFKLAEGVTTNETAAMPVTYNQQINGNDTGITTIPKVIAVGTPITNPWTVYSDGVLAPEFSHNEITAGASVVNVNFVKKTSPAIGLDTYYRLKIARSTQLFATKSGNIAEKYCTKNFLANYFSSYWKFVQDGLHVKMVSYDGKYLKLSTVPTNNDGKGDVNYVDNVADATSLYLCNKPSNSAYTGEGGFVLKVGNPSDNVAIGDHNEKKLCAWKSTGAFADEGSCFVVAPNGEFDLVGACSILSSRVHNDLQNQPAISDNILRVADTEALKSVNNALTGAGGNTTPKTLLNAYNLAYKAPVDKNAYYRIKSQGTCNNEATAKRYPSSEAIVTDKGGVLQGNVTRTITRKTASDNIVAQLWQFKDAGDGNYFIQNANTGCRWAATEDNIDMPTMANSDAAGHYSIDAIPVANKTFSEGAISDVNDGKSKFFITLHLKGQHAINAHGGLNDFDVLKEDASNATPCNDPGNYWQIEKIENFDVAINAAAKYATVGYPFPVQVTTPNVKVYYATEAENGILKLTEATNNIIPANEGAILYCESGQTTANMKILPSTESTFADNKLTATTAKREGFTTLTTYGLSNMNGVVCFRKNSSTNVPANKAYLDADNYTSNSGSAQQLLFSFDNVVEGIDNVVKAQNANKVYYDLQGRRVLYPANGIFVTENGEKVFIK